MQTLVIRNAGCAVVALGHAVSRAVAVAVRHTVHVAIATCLAGGRAIADIWTASMRRTAAQRASERSFAGVDRLHTARAGCVADSV